MNDAAPLREKLFTGRFLQLCLANLLVFLGFHMQVSTFSFFVLDLGGDEAIAGLAVGIFSISAVITRPFMGWILDNKSRRLPMSIGLIFLLSMSLLYTFTTKIVVVIMLRLLQGVAWSAANTSVYTAASDIAPRSRYSEGLGYFGLMTAISVAFAPTVGLGIMNKYGFDAMFVTSAALTTACLFLSLFTFSRMPAYVSNKPKQDLLHSLKTLINRDALPSSVITFFFLLPMGAVMSFVAVYAQTELSITNGGIYFTSMAITTAAARILTGKVVDVKGEGPILYASFVFMLSSLLLLVFFQSLISLVISALLIGAAFGMMAPTTQAMALHISTPERRGSANATYLCANDIGFGLGGMLGGILVKHYGFDNMFLMVSGFVVISFVCYFFWAKNTSASLSYNPPNKP